MPSIPYPLPSVSQKLSSADWCHWCHCKASSSWKSCGTQRTSPMPEKIAHLHLQWSEESLVLHCSQPSLAFSGRSQTFLVEAISSYIKDTLLTGSSKNGLLKGNCASSAWLPSKMKPEALWMRGRWWMLFTLALAKPSAQSLTVNVFPVMEIMHDLELFGSVWSNQELDSTVSMSLFQISIFCCSTLCIFFPHCF